MRQAGFEPKMGIIALGVPRRRLCGLILISVLLLILYLGWASRRRDERGDTYPNDVEETPTEGPEGEAQEDTPQTDEAMPLVLTILYDNNEHDKRLQTGWGFSCLVEGLDETILFDTGGDGSKLLSNMRILGIDPSVVDVVVISHIHQDHLGGLSDFLKANHEVRVYLPSSFPGNVKQIVGESGAALVEVSGPAGICEGAYTTGELGSTIREQSLLIETENGVVVVTGCAHPGVVQIVREAKSQLRTGILLVVGGFHLSSVNAATMEGIVEGMRSEGVEKVAPCHCSGDLARRMFADAYGDDFSLVGVGSRLEVRSGGQVTQ